MSQSGTSGQVQGARNAIYKFVDQSGTSGQVRGCQKCNLQVRGSKWHLETSSGATHVFNSIFYILRDNFCDLEILSEIHYFFQIENDEIALKIEVGRCGVF